MAVNMFLICFQLLPESTGYICFFFLGPERKNAVIEEKNRILVAYHESGHAVVAMYTPGIYTYNLSPMFSD